MNFKVGDRVWFRDQITGFGVITKIDHEGVYIKDEGGSPYGSRYIFIDENETDDMVVPEIIATTEVFQLLHKKVDSEG